MVSMRLLRYGLLGIPLAFVGLPLYVHIPRFYADTQHMDLSRLGVLLLALRLFDTLLDPVIGVVSDRLRAHRRLIMILCLPLLAGGYFLLFSPPSLEPSRMLVWLAACLSVVYAAFSTLMINYYAVGIDMAEGYDENTRISAWREGAMLLGVLLASLLPAVLSTHYGTAQSYRLFGLLLSPLLLACTWATLSVMPSVTHAGAMHRMPGLLAGLLKDARIRWTLAVALFNAIPTAITSTLFLFFTADVLGAQVQSGPMLAVYFLSAACAMPIWTFVSARQGKRKALLMAMLLAIACFVWVWELKAGDILPFYLICVVSGATLGADAALLPALFADALADNRRSGATAFGLWNVTSKLTMALAAGIALPLLERGGYHAGGNNSAHALHSLSFCYALLPCIFKAVAIGLLYISPLDQEGHHT